MNQTVTLLEKIREAIADGRLSGEQVPIEAIKLSVRSELQVHQNTFIASQYGEITGQLERLCNDLPDWEKDTGKILLFIDAAILCVDMISEAVKTLANGEYWSLRHLQELDNPEILEIIDFVDRERKVRLLNYDFVEKYEKLTCEICLDEVSGMKYIPYKNKKMFFPRGWEDSEIADYYRSVVAEQDAESPHCYAKGGYDVKFGDVIVDAGAAEGIFALDTIDIAGKLYLIEADEKWVEALQQTFRDDGDKVRIIYGFLDEITEGNRVSIDGLFAEEEINYIKMDIEGYEKPAVMGAVKTLTKSHDIRCAVCAYHCRGDEKWLTEKLQECGMETSTSRGYICPDWTVEAYLEAELRRGIVFGRKKLCKIDYR